MPVAAVAKYPNYNPTNPKQRTSNVNTYSNNDDYIDQLGAEAVSHQSTLVNHDSLLSGVAYNLSAVVAKGGSAGISLITVSVLDRNGNVLAGVSNFDLWLSDAATGAGLTATTASGGIAANTSGGAVIGVLTSAKALRVQTLANGTFCLAITDIAKTAFVIAGQVPGSSKTVVLATLSAASYD